MLSSSIDPGSDLVEALLDGDAEADAVALLRERVEQAAAEHGGARVLIEVRRYEDPSSVQVQRELRDLGRSPALARWALVADGAGFRTAATAMLAFVPAEGRVFADRAEALTWLRS